VKRIVITSSCAAILHVSPNPEFFSEKDWNLQAVEVVEREGEGAIGITKYRASKTLAEKGSWDRYGFFWS
jgi:hypothetical protein